VIKLLISQKTDNLACSWM